MVSTHALAAVLCFLLLQQKAFASFTVFPRRIVPGNTDKLTIVCTGPDEIKDPVIAVMIRKADGMDLEQRSSEVEYESEDEGEGVDQGGRVMERSMDSREEQYDSQASYRPSSYANKFYRGRRRRDSGAFEYASLTGSGLVTVPNDKEKFQISGELSHPARVTLVMNKPTAGDAGQYACQMTYMTMSGQVEVKTQSLEVSEIQIENEAESKHLQSTAASESRLATLEKQAQMFVSLGQGMQAAGKLQDEKMQMLAEDIKALKKENKELVSTLEAVNMEVKGLNDKIKDIVAKQTTLSEMHDIFEQKLNDTDSAEKEKPETPAAAAAVPKENATSAQHADFGAFNPMNPVANRVGAQQPYGGFNPAAAYRNQQYAQQGGYFPQQRYGGGFPGAYAGYGGVRQPGFGVGGFAPNQIGGQGRQPAAPSVEEDLFAVNTRMGAMDNTRIQTLQKQVKQLQDLVVNLQDRMIKVEVKVNYTIEDEIKEVENEAENGGSKNVNERLVRIENHVLPVIMANISRLQTRMKLMQNLTGVAGEITTDDQNLNLTEVFATDAPTDAPTDASSSETTEASGVDMLQNAFLEGEEEMSSTEVEPISSSPSETTTIAATTDTTLSVGSSLSTPVADETTTVSYTTDSSTESLAGEYNTTNSTSQPATDGYTTQSATTSGYTTQQTTLGYTTQQTTLGYTTQQTTEYNTLNTQSTEATEVTESPTQTTAVTEDMSGRHSCYVCGDPDNKKTCTRRDHENTEYCEEDQEACITEVQQDGYFRKLYRKCATLKECVLTPTITDKPCYNETFMTAKQLSCHFCCTSDNCNTEIRPTADLYTYNEYH